MCQKQGAIKMNPLLLTHSILVMDIPLPPFAAGVYVFLPNLETEKPYFSLLSSAFTALVTSVLRVSLI